MADKIENIAEMFQDTERFFNLEAAADMDAVLQFVVTGDGGGTWHAVVKDGKMDIHDGGTDAATMTMTCAVEDMLGMVNGEANPMTLFMMGKLKIDGDMAQALKLQQLIKSG